MERQVARLRAHEAQRTAVAEQLARVPGLSKPVRAHWLPHTSQAWHLSWDGVPRGDDAPTGRSSITPRARVDVDAEDNGEHVEIELSGLAAPQAEQVLRALLKPEQPDLARGPPSDGVDGSAHSAERVRAAHGAVQRELIAALDNGLAQRVTDCYTGAAWLVVDPSRWLETWGDSDVELLMAILENGSGRGFVNDPCR